MATVNAVSTQTLLNVTSSGQECMKTSIVNVPNYGNATFEMTERWSFKEMTVNAGTNTQNIMVGIVGWPNSGMKI